MSSSARRAAVALVDARFAFTKTAGIAGILPECTSHATMLVPIDTTVIYCYQIENTGSEPLSVGRLVDSHLGIVPTPTGLVLAPGEGFSTTARAALTVSTTNVATWTASLADIGPGLAARTVLPALATTSWWLETRQRPF